MANRYLVAGGSGLWNATDTNNWSATSGGASGASCPTATDDVFLDAASGAASIGIQSTAACRSVDCTGFTGTLSLGGAVTWNISGSLTLVAGMTVSGVAFSTQNFNGASSYTITTAGKPIGKVTINAVGGTYQLQDDLTVGSTGTATLTHTAGTLDTNGKTVLCGGFNSNNTNTRTLTLGSSSITCSTTSPWNVNVTNLTVSANTATVTCSASGASFITWQTFNWNGMSVVFTGGTANTGVTTNLTFANFTFTGTAVKTGVLTLYGNITCTGTFACNGDSTTNRVLVNTNTLGTARTITAATVSCSNVDFQDITGAGAGSWNLSAITGLSGDCGGNSGITFTTPATQTRSGNGNPWSYLPYWSGRVPLPQDDVSFSGTGTGTVTADMPRMGANIDFTGWTSGTLNHNSTPNTVYGSLTLISGMTLNSTQTLTLGGRGTHTITAAGKSFGSTVTFAAFGGTYTFQDAFTTAGRIDHNNGSLDLNSQTITVSAFWSLSPTTRAITGGTSTINLTSTAAVNIWIGTPSGMTQNLDNTTIVLVNASASQRDLVSLGTVGTLTHTVAGSPGLVYIRGSAASFAAINFTDASNARTLRFQSGITYTIRNGSLFNVNGTSGKLMSIDTNTAGSAATLAVTTGTISCDYLSVKDNTVTTTTPAYAGANGTLVSGTTNWLASAPPSSGTPNLLLMGIG